MGEQQGADVRVSYIKSSQFRVIFAEGAYGGVAPRGTIQFALYNERTALPQEGQMHIDPDGIMSEEITQTRGGIVREVEAVVAMNINEAEEFARWLAQKVAQCRALVDQAAQPDVS